MPNVNELVQKAVEKVNDSANKNMESRISVLVDQIIDAENDRSKMTNPCPICHMVHAPDKATELARLREENRVLREENEAFKPTICQHDDPTWCDYKCFQSQLAIYRDRARHAEAALSRTEHK